jgi:glycosyltransferase involved in cell wall biosynthesis
MERIKRVLAITVDQSEAPFRLRMEILRDLLGQDGYHFDFVARPRSWFERRRLVAGAGDYDAVIVQRKLLDPSHANLLRRRAPRVIYDIDDAVMTQRRKIGRVSRWLKRRRYLATARIMDHVVAGNQNLADAFAQLGCAVTTLPTVVDPDHYQVKTHAPTEHPTLVWIGSRSTVQYVRQWMPALEEAARRLPGLRLLTIANEGVQSDVIEVQHIPWSLDTEAASLARGEIGIAPTPLDPWTLGKCGFKIIQYMATGLPVIASPVGMNSDIVTADETGLLPETMEQWPDAIVKLAGDVNLRAKMGAQGRQRVLSDFSLNKAREVWKKILGD